MESPLGLRLEILLQGSSRVPQTALDLLEDLIEAWLVLTKEAFELGQRNSRAEQFLVEGEDDTLEVSDEIVGAQSFVKILDESSDCTQMLCTEIAKLLLREPALQDGSRSLVSQKDLIDEPKELAWQLVALTHSLESEKAWTQELERRNTELKERLRLLEAKSPLSSAIIQMLLGRKGE